MDVQSIYPQVAKIVAEVLATEESKVTLHTRLIGDLGGESIDFLDLVFRLERQFGVKIPRGQIEKEVRGMLSSEDFEKEGVLTDKGLEALRNYLSEIPPDRFKKGLKVNEIPSLFTVETFCKLVLRAQERAKTSTA
jgi:acyl carrier protein